MKTNHFSIPGLAVMTGACLLFLNQESYAASSKQTPITGKRTDPPVELKAEWKPGKRYVMLLELNQGAQMNFGQRPTSQETVFSQDYTVTVTNASDGARGLEMEIQSLAIEVAFGETTVLRYDSLNKVAPPEGRGVENMEKLIGGKVRFLVNADNKVTEVDGVKELIQRVTGAPNTPEAADPAAGGRRGRRGIMGAGDASGAMQMLYNGDYLKQFVDISGLPSSAQRIGDTWTTKREINAMMMGTLVVNTTNTFRGWQVHEGKKCARIEFSGNLEAKADRAEGMPWAGLVKIENGKVQGTSWFSPDIGMAVETSVNQSYNITGTIPQWGRRGGGTNAPAATNAPPQRFSIPNRISVNLKLTDVQSADQPIKPRTPAGSASGATPSK